MERKVKILAALLGLQIAAALALSWNASTFSSPRGDHQLLDFEAAAVDSIIVFDGEGESIELSKGSKGWQLPALNGFPADSARIEQLLERLQQLESRAAIASSRDARKRFKVSDEAFERKLILKRGEQELASLYLGTTPGMRRIHARADSADTIHRVEFAASDLPLDHEAWQDNTILQFPQNEVTALKIGDLRLDRVSDGDNQVEWRADGLAEGELIDRAKVDELVRLIANLRVGRVLDDDRGLSTLEEPALELDVTRQGKETISYRLGQSAEDEQFLLKVSSRPEYFHLPRFRAQSLLDNASREALLKLGEAASAEESAAGATDAASGEAS